MNKINIEKLYNLMIGVTRIVCVMPKALDTEKAVTRFAEALGVKIKIIKSNVKKNHNKRK
jgi:hypothetical protein